MYSFNLLPPPYQRAARRWLISSHLTHGVILLNGICIVILGFFLMFTMVTQQSIRSTEESITWLNQQPIEELDGKSTQDLRMQLSSLFRIQSEHPPYLFLMNELFTRIPDGIALTSLSVDYEKRLITISAVATDRSAVKQLQKEIGTDTRFTIEAFPIEAFTEASTTSLTVQLLFDPQDFTYATATQEASPDDRL